MEMSHLEDVQYAHRVSIEYRSRLQNELRQLSGEVAGLEVILGRWRRLGEEIAASPEAKDALWLGDLKKMLPAMEGEDEAK